MKFKCEVCFIWTTYSFQDREAPFRKMTGRKLYLRSCDEAGLQQMYYSCRDLLPVRSTDRQLNNSLPFYITGPKGFGIVLDKIITDIILKVVRILTWEIVFIKHASTCESISWKANSASWTTVVIISLLNLVAMTTLYYFNYILRSHKPEFFCFFF